jgi:hypothetical protein
MLKCEEFTDLAAIMQYAFGESDRIERRYYFRQNLLKNQQA